MIASSSIVKLCDAYYDNVWTVIHAFVGWTRSKGALVLLDQEKAYDQVNWLYLHRCMGAFGFGLR
jgi:hypothetical protein